jgi:hypothetical protein
VTFASYLVERLEADLLQWQRAAQTLPMRDLIAQRDELRDKCPEAIGVKPEALILRVLNREIRRREGA